MAKTTQISTPRAPSRVVVSSRKTSPVPAPAPQETKVETGLRFYIADAFRPTAGERLAAHTAVFLEHSGLFAGKAIPKDKARTVIGARAIKWHMDAGNFCYTSQGLALTELGKAAFGKRVINDEYKAAYVAILVEGKTHEGVGVTNPAFVLAL